MKSLEAELKEKVAELERQIDYQQARILKDAERVTALELRESELENEVEYWHKLWQRASLERLEKTDTRQDYKAQGSSAVEHPAHNRAVDGSTPSPETMQPAENIMDGSMTNEEWNRQHLKTTAQERVDRSKLAVERLNDFSYLKERREKTTQEGGK